MSLTTYHRAQSQNPNLEPYEVAHHKAQARLLADPAGFHQPDNDDIVRTLADAAEALDDDDLRILDDSDLAGLLARVDVARDQCEAELDRRKRRANK